MFITTTISLLVLLELRVLHAWQSSLLWSQARPRIQTKQQRHIDLCRRKDSKWVISAKTDPEQEFDDDDTSTAAFNAEKSQMTGFVMDYLKRANSLGADEESASASSSSSNEPGEKRHTHLVGLPMENCHQLLIELESVQRAILYHCPILVHACIPQVTTRLPLLFVTADNDAATTEKLFDMVHDVVKSTLFSSPTDNDNNDNHRQDAEPLMLRFQKLEMDNGENDVLYAATANENVERLRHTVQRLQERIHAETNWSTELPVDPNSSDLFRPRIPFMRLPETWNDILKREYPDAEVDEGGKLILSADEGGNGISPILWYKWLTDDFGTARMREVAIYRGTEGYNVPNEENFHLPMRSVQLPMGDDATTKAENKFRDYQEERMQEAEAYFENYNAGTEPPEPASTADDDLLMTKTRSRLESLYESSSPETSFSDAIQEELVEKENAAEEAEIESDLDLSPPKVRPEDPSALNDWTRQRIQQAIANREKVKSEQRLGEPKVKPPIKDNDVFRKYKEGTLAPKQKTEPPKPKLGPFPTREHCIGFWRVVASPTGFMVEEGDPSRSDNLILRVDGTTAGGPILDQETRQKASGGTWRLKGTTREDASLLIRLVIPPEKNRVLVMEGRLENASLSSSDFALADSSFKIPEVEARKTKNGVATMEDILHCSGSVWVEDAVTKANRDDVGTFSLMKLELSSDPESYTITVPRSVRNQD